MADCSKFADRQRQSFCLRSCCAYVLHASALYPYPSVCLFVTLLILHLTLFPTGCNWHPFAISTSWNPGQNPLTNDVCAELMSCRLLLQSRPEPREPTWRRELKPSLIGCFPTKENWYASAITIIIILQYYCCSLISLGFVTLADYASCIKCQVVRMSVLKECFYLTAVENLF